MVVSNVTINYIPVANTITLSGGSLFVGIALAITLQTVWSFPLVFNLFNDKNRQSVLNLICLIGALTGIVAYPVNQTGTSIWAQNICTLIIFVCVQYGLVIITHNSFARANNISMKTRLEQSTLDWCCLFLYFLPIFVLIPVYIAAYETLPNLPVNLSSYNALYYKPLNIGLVVATEFLASISDIWLLKQTLSMKFAILRNSNDRSDRSKKRISGESVDLMASYFCIWSLLMVDIFIKVLIIRGVPVLFDSIISITTIALRARCNLQYGLNMKSIFRKLERSDTAKGDV